MVDPVEANVSPDNFKTWDCLICFSVTATTFFTIAMHFFYSLGGRFHGSFICIQEIWNSATGFNVASSSLPLQLPPHLPQSLPDSRESTVHCCDNLLLNLTTIRETYIFFWMTTLYNSCKNNYTEPMAWSFITSIPLRYLVMTYQDIRCVPFSTLFFLTKNHICIYYQLPVWQ